MDPSGVRAEVRRACRSAVDPLALYRDAADLLAPVVGFDRWCGLLLDPATLLNTGGYHEEGLPVEVLPRLLEIEVGEVDTNAIPALGRSRSGVSTLDRATDGRPTESRRFREVLEPAGLGREMRAVLRDRGSAWGGLVFFRETTDSDFTDAEIALVADVGADLARAVRRCLLHSEHAHRDQPDGPGMASLRVEDMDVGWTCSAGRLGDGWRRWPMDGCRGPGCRWPSSRWFSVRSGRRPAARTCGCGPARGGG